jgi:PPOX class probable F420-dependent enzyme
VPKLIDRVAATRYVSLTTFRKTGMPVTTPVWIAREAGNDTLLVLTSTGTGKAKRLRNNPRIELRPADVRGRVPAGARTLMGTVELVTEEREVTRLSRDLQAKYGIQFRLFRFVESLIPHEGSDVILRITLD